MKTTIQILLTFTFLLFSFCMESNAQTDRTITLYVNTAEIVKPDVNSFCDFGQSDGSSNEDFTIIAEVGDTIIWKGESTSSGDDIVNITAINHQGGKNIFDRNVLNGNGDSPETVSGEVLYKTVDENGNKNYKYTIFFTVSNNGQIRNGKFQIDPKIQVSR